MATASPKGYVILTLAFHREGRNWVGECLELGTSTFARSLEQVHAELVELVELHLEGLQEDGELEYFFEKPNIPFYGEIPTSITRTVRVNEGHFLNIHTFALPLAA